MSFRPVFIAVVLGFALIVAAFLVNRARPPVEAAQPTADLIRASGECAACHLQQQYAVVHEYALSAHAQKGINCLQCHQPAQGQQRQDHHGLYVAKSATVKSAKAMPYTDVQRLLSRKTTPPWESADSDELIWAT